MITDFSKTPASDSKSLSGILTIKDVTLHVHLGVTEEEQAKPQPVSLELSILLCDVAERFGSDDIETTHCYDNILQQLSIMTQQKQYKLIEKLCYDLFMETKKLTNNAKLTIKASKSPSVLEQKINASFSISDIEI